MVEDPSHVVHDAVGCKLGFRNPNAAINGVLLEVFLRQLLHLSPSKSADKSGAEVFNSSRGDDQTVSLSNGGLQSAS